MNTVKQSISYIHMKVDGEISETHCNGRHDFEIYFTFYFLNIEMFLKILSDF